MTSWDKRRAPYHQGNPNPVNFLVSEIQLFVMTAGWPLCHLPGHNFLNNPQKISHPLRKQSHFYQKWPELGFLAKGRVPYHLLREGTRSISPHERADGFHFTSWEKGRVKDVVSFMFFASSREWACEVALWCSQLCSLGSLPLRAHNLPAWPAALSGKPAGSLVGGVMSSRNGSLCGEIWEKMHFHFILE